MPSFADDIHDYPQQCQRLYKTIFTLHRFAGNAAPPKDKISQIFATVIRNQVEIVDHYGLWYLFEGLRVWAIVQT